MPKAPLTLDPSQRDGKGVGKQYVGIGRMNFKANDAPPSQRDLITIKKPMFDASEGRDYDEDAPENEEAEAKPKRRKPRDEHTHSSHSNRSNEKKPEENFTIPEIKSPAQVAAEKAAEWKRQQLEAEAAKKNKSYIKKKVNHNQESNAP